MPTNHAPSRQVFPLRHRLGAMFLTLALVVVACGGDVSDDDPNGAAPPDADPTETPTPEDGPSDGVLRIGYATAVQTFDPAGAGLAQITYLQPVYDSLLEIDGERNLSPGLAEDWDFDGTTVTLQIRAGVQFTDGEVLDASVVVANIERTRDHAGPQAAAFRDVDTVTATGDMTVEITLGAPAPTILEDLALLAGMMISPAALDDPALDRNPIGSGPWIYDAGQSREGDVHVYTLNPDYWKPEDQGVTRIEIFEMTDETARMNALRSGQVNVIDARGRSLVVVQDEGFEVVSSPDQFWTLVILDREGELVPALGDQRVRRAIAHTIDREAIVDAIFDGFGLPLAQPFPPGHMGHIPGLEEEFAYDLDRARELLADAGYEDGFSFTLPAIAPQRELAEVLAASLAEVGITMEIEMLQPGTLGGAAMTGDWMGLIMIPGVGDPHTMYRTWVLPQAPFNPFGVVNETLIELGQRGAELVDPEERHAVYQEMMREIYEDGLLTVFAIVDKTAAHGPTVSGLQYRAGDRVPNPRGARVDE